MLIVLFLLYEMSGLDTSVETESRLEVARARGRGVRCDYGKGMKGCGNELGAALCEHHVPPSIVVHIKMANWMSCDCTSI